MNLLAALVLAAASARVESVEPDHPGLAAGGPGGPVRHARHGGGPPRGRRRPRLHHGRRLGLRFAGGRRFSWTPSDGFDPALLAATPAKLDRLEIAATRVRGERAAARPARRVGGRAARLARAARRVPKAPAEPERVARAAPVASSAPRRPSPSRRPRAVAAPPQPAPCRSPRRLSRPPCRSSRRRRSRPRRPSRRPRRRWPRRAGRRAAPTPRSSQSGSSRARRPTPRPRARGRSPSSTRASSRPAPRGRRRGGGRPRRGIVEPGQDRGLAVGPLPRARRRWTRATSTPTRSWRATVEPTRDQLPRGAAAGGGGGAGRRGAASPSTTRRSSAPSPPTTRSTAAATRSAPGSTCPSAPSVTLRARDRFRSGVLDTRVVDPGGEYFFGLGRFRRNDADAGASIVVGPRLSVELGGRRRARSASRRSRPSSTTTRGAPRPGSGSRSRRA